RQTHRRLSSRAASTRRHVPDDRRRAFGALLRRLGRLGERPVGETGRLGRQGLLLRRRARSRQSRRAGPRRHRIHLGPQPAALLQTRQSVRNYVRRRQLSPRRDCAESRGWGRGLKNFVELLSRITPFEYRRANYGLIANDILFTRRVAAG